MRFLLMHQAVVEHDAIGRDIAGMYQSLAPAYPCHLFCEYGGNVAGMARVDVNGAKALLAERDCVVLYHHSIHWPLGEELLGKAAGPVVFKYHNITPPNYFAGCAGYWQACLAGREQTYRFARCFPDALWLADSLFNLQELGIEGGMFYRVAPPFLGLSDRDDTEPDEALLRELISGQELHLLFVGRFAPNKGHLFLLDVMHEYTRKYGAGAILHIIGKKEESLRGYYDSFLARAAQLDLTACVDVVGEINASSLLSYYLGSDVYLCCSEHEGFCVPVVEAQSLSLPVVARGLSAVPETIGDGQILLGEDPAAYADALQQLRTDDAFRETIIENGRRNYRERFHTSAIRQRFLGALQDLGAVV